jgi:hypothetical protein
MSLIKSIAVAALAFGIAGGAFAAESKFLAPNVVEGIVKGEVISVYNKMQDERARAMLRTYLIGFGSAMHAECGILPSSVEGKIVQTVKTVLSRRDDTSTAMRAGYDDGKLLVTTYGCGSDVGQAASRTVRGYMK